MDLDRYELIDVIGRGGMATVWRARDRRLDRLVAVKRPAPDSDPRRFEEEGRLAAGVVHPNVVRIYDVGSDGDGPYLVMELVDGPSVAESDVEPGRTQSVGLAIASALAALHAAGIVHGDVKPANILLAADGARLTDFGVARQGAQAGPVWATPSYAAPEVAAGGTPTPASDVYSLAIVLHELVTGVDWSSPGATQPLPTGDWAGILAAALATDPADRPDAAAFARSLEHLAPGAIATPATVPITSAADRPTAPSPPRPHPSGAPTATARHRTSNRALAGAAFLGVLALVVGVAAVAARSGDEVTSSPTATSADAIAAAATTAPVAATPAASHPTTVPDTTAPDTTALPTTEAPPTTPAPTPADSLAAAFVALVEEQPPNDLKPKEARDLLERLQRVVDRAREQRDVDNELGELAKRVDEHLSGRAHDRGEELVLALAEALGADADDLDEWFDDGADGDD